MSDRTQPMTEHSPLPWRAANGGFLLAPDGSREVQVAKVGDFFDKALLPFNKERWQADLELIVKAVNSYAANQDRIERATKLIEEGNDALAKLINAEARIAELESNERAYKEIIGPMTYREVADRIEELEVALHQINSWSRAYPLRVFPEPDLKKVRELLEAGGITLDSVSASCMRHCVEGVGKIASDALQPKELK